VPWRLSSLEEVYKLQNISKYIIRTTPILHNTLTHDSVKDYTILLGLPLFLSWYRLSHL